MNRNNKSTTLIIVICIILFVIIAGLIIEDCIIDNAWRKEILTLASNPTWEHSTDYKINEDIYSVIEENLDTIDNPESGIIFHNEDNSMFICIYKHDIVTLDRKACAIQIRWDDMI